MSGVVTLALDASTYVGTVAVLRDGVVAAEGDALMRGEREERLMPAVVAILAEAGCTPREVSRVICGAGPGSFTSLRIAGAIAKGIALGAGAELCEVSSLALVVAGHYPPLPVGRYLASLDAMRGERYAAVYEVRADASIVEHAPARIVAEAALPALCEQFGARAIGPHQLLDVAPHARGVAALDDGSLVRPVALDSWEPSYGRLAEAQVKWEAAHGRPLSA